jgi:NAD(P)-dependent dehydrogenase (short-subunit alcohol dehydrogenase family)
MPPTTSHPFALDGKNAFVTGASRGIGRAIALALAEAGADVAVTARSTAALESLGDEIGKLGRTALALTCDVRDADQIGLAVADAHAELGNLDIVVNCAGAIAHVGPFLELTAEDWRGLFQVNFESTLHVCRAAGRHLTAQGSGSVINVASVAGIRGVPMLSHYAASKAALISLTQSLAAEWAARGVRVNALAPGWVATEMTQGFAADPDIAAGLLGQVPAGRWGEARDVAGAAVYLASDAARLVTGACLTMDGAMTSSAGGPALISMLAAGRIANG